MHPTQATLAQIQHQLRRLIDRPAEIPSAIATLPVASDERLSAAQRVEIYASMYFLRLRDALAEDFRALHLALGDSEFERLARDYFTAHPSSSFTLRDAGCHLARFLAAAPDRGFPAWIDELARLEWALVDAFDATDEPVLERTALEKLAPEQWGDLLVRPVRSLQLLELRRPVDRLRERLLDGASRDEAIAEVAAASKAATTWVRVWRQGFVVYVRRVDEVEAEVLRACVPGMLFADVCEQLAEVMGDAEAAPGRALALLGSWLGDELLAA